jgi:hypothetical protein
VLSWRVNIVTDDIVLTERLKLHLKRERQLELSYTSEPEEKDTDILILPAYQLTNLATLKLKRVDKWLPVIVYGSHLFLRKAFLSGCYDYLKEPWGTEELLLRLERLTQLLEKHHTFIYDSLSLAGNCLESPGRQTLLSYEESQILKMLLRQRGTVVTLEILYYTIWDKPPAVKSRVIDMHISTIKKKLAAHGLAGIIISVRGQGYMLI